MKKRNKIGLIAAGLVAIIFGATSCTANFCTNLEKGRIAFALEPGVSEYYNAEDFNKLSLDFFILL